MVGWMDRISVRRTAALLLTLGLAVATSAHAHTLSPLPALPGYVHQVFGIDDGLPRAGIVQVMQTRDGYLWLATFDGLVRFDGARFEVFDSDRFPALGSNRIVDLLESRDGTLWIRSEVGHVARYTGGAITGCSVPKADRAGSCSLPHAGEPRLTFLYEDPAGAIWMGGRSGLFRASADGLHRVQGLNLRKEVHAILRDRAGRLWVGGAEGLWTGRPGHFQKVSVPSEVQEEGVSALVEDASGDVWAATMRGAGRVRDGALRLEVLGQAFLDRDSAGTVWISVEGRLLRFRAGRLETVATGEGKLHGMIVGRRVRIAADGSTWMGWTDLLLRNGTPVLRLSSPIFAVNSVTIDREGTIWASSSDSGELHALHPAHVTTLSEGLPSPVLYPVYEDRDGTLWTGGLGTLAFLPPGSTRFQTLPIPGDAPLATPEAFLRDRSGTFWIGLAPGLFFRDGDRFVGPVGPEALRTAVIRAIFEDSRGVLWVGTERGLFRREPVSLSGQARGGRWSWLTTENGLPNPWIRAIRESPEGTLWLGTNGGGVVRLAQGRFTAIGEAQGLSSNLVRAIHPAPDGRLWIATENRGINRLDPSTLDRLEGPRIDQVGLREGLYARGVHQIVPDDFGNLWMSSNEGIFRVSQRDLNEVADGRRQRIEPVAYTERDGMRNREANGGVQDAGLRDRRGRIVFPTQVGVVRIDPRRLLERGTPPPVYVQRLRSGDGEIPVSTGPDSSSKVRLGPSQRSFTVELSAPSFRAPERQRFRYRLMPYDRDWVEAGARREASYTKVPPGDYAFEVLASGPDGVWSERPARVEIEVVPRFFETVWFLLACAAGAIAAVAALLRWRGNRLQARQARLEQLVEERTTTIADQAEKLRELDRLKSQLFANVSHELRTPLTLILGPLGDALAGRFGPLNEDLSRQVSTAERNARRLLTLVDQLLDVARLDAGRLRLRLRRGDLGGFVRYRVESFLPLAERRGIDLSLEVPVEPVELWFDPPQLEKVIDNLLGNALKFTPAGGRVEVSLDAPPDADRVEVAVRDNGPGIPDDQLERVFERFYQLDPTAHRWRGAGIGLALARQVAELHRGEVSVRSNAGQGACFILTLLRGRDHFPAELVDDDTPPPHLRDYSSGPLQSLSAALDEPNGPTGGDDPVDEDRTTVLVVDDNPEIRAYVRRHLEPDYRVLEAADGAEGLERARRTVPDLVVSDVMMPGLDGNALFRALREDPELETVPVVLLTAKASPESRIQGLRDGVDDYLVKPFDPRELKARVDNLIASRRRLLERLESDPKAGPGSISGENLDDTLAEPVPRPLRVSEVRVLSADQALLARVQSIIENRIADTALSVEALAEEIGCDRSYLLRKLRTLTGETPSALIRSMRLQRAEQLLRANAGTVSEIAYSVGFKSVAHFSNAFQERYGERPSAFAARHRG
jgi:signal transduction histidine kinase/ligand-binding sensor domain-containing protein/DNA-binding response OmpR family regulator